MAKYRYDFQHAPTLKRAMMSSALVKIVQGPVESGKTHWLIMSMYRDMCSIPRCKDGIRRSRFLVVRNSSGELERGIMRSYKNIFPPKDFGEIQGKMPAIHKIKFMDVECEVEFFAFEDDSVAVMRKLRSTEYTKAYINEGQYISLRMLIAVRQRTGRFPRAIDCPDWDRAKRVDMDMNAPPMNNHWVLYMRGDIDLPADMLASEKRKFNKPQDWEFFVQPGAVKPIYDHFGEIVSFEIHPDIENLPYQDTEAILSMCQTGEIDDIKRDYMNQYVQVKDGAPRYPKFKRDWHVHKGRMKAVPGISPVIGWDPSKYGAATFWQKVNNQWRCSHELNARNNVALQNGYRFVEKMKEYLSTYYPWHSETGITCWSDPFGDRDMISEEFTYWTIAQAQGLNFSSPMPKDNPSMRLEIGTKVVSDGEYGQPKMLICPVGAPTLVDAFDGGATMKQVKRGSDLVTQSQLLKNKHADIIESAEYAFWGGGESTSIIEVPESARIPSRVETVEQNSSKRRFGSGSKRQRTWSR